MSLQITTLSIFNFTTLKSKVWAFSMMQRAHRELKNQNGLRFYKLLGTGKPGFDPMPDWNTYAILQVWTDEKAADLFFNDSLLFQRYNNCSKTHFVLFLKNIVSRGEWDGHIPFEKHREIDNSNPYLVVLTRATIKAKFLFRFWKSVPESQERLNENTGLIYTKGIGEVPFKQMATVSLWRSQDDLENFAYGEKGHLGAIKKTRELRWYSEELFSRFQPYRYLGSLEGAQLPKKFSQRKK